MWDAFMDWLPDLNVGTFEIRDLVSLIIGGLGAYLACLAIKLGKEQAAISKRQAEIAEMQLQIQSVQVGRQAELKVDWGLDTDTAELQILVENIGIAAVEVLEWWLFIGPVSDEFSIQVFDAVDRRLIPLKGPKPGPRLSRAARYFVHCTTAQVLSVDVERPLAVCKVNVHTGSVEEGIQLEDKDMIIRWRIKTKYRTFASDESTTFTLPLDLFHTIAVEKKRTDAEQE